MNHDEHRDLALCSSLRFNALTPSKRLKATVKWRKRPYALMVYSDDQPGLYMGIVLKSSCVSNQSCRPDVCLNRMCISERFGCKVEGEIKFIGTYSECAIQFSMLAQKMFSETFRTYIKKKPK